MSISQRCLYIATLGKIGRMPGGSVIASAAVVLLMIIGKLVHWLSPTIALWFFAGLIIGALIVLFMALRAISEQDSSAIVLDELIGVSIMYAGLPLGLVYWKIYLFAFITFHALTWCVPYILVMLKNEALRTLNSQGIIGLIASDIILGLVLNGFLRLCLWWSF